MGCLFLLVARKAAGSAYWKRTYPCQCLKSQVVSLHCFNAMRSGESTVAIHHKSHMLRDRPLAQSTYQELLQVRDRELDGRRGQEPLSESRQVYGVRHGEHV